VLARALQSQYEREARLDVEELSAGGHLEVALQRRRVVGRQPEQLRVGGRIHARRGDPVRAKLRQRRRLLYARPQDDGGDAMGRDTGCRGYTG